MTTRQIYCSHTAWGALPASRTTPPWARRNRSPGDPQRAGPAGDALVRGGGLMEVFEGASFRRDAPPVEWLYSCYRQDSETTDGERERERDSVVPCGRDSDLYVHRTLSGPQRYIPPLTDKSSYCLAAGVESGWLRVVIKRLLIMVWSICREVLEEHLLPTVSKEAT